MISIILATLPVLSSDSCNPHKLVPDETGGGFGGGGLAVEGMTAVVGAQAFTFDGQSRGAAFVFRLGPQGWVRTQLLYAPDDHTGSQFGADVSMSGDTLAVAAPEAWNVASSSWGAIYVFRRNEVGWFFDAKLIDPQAQQFDHFAGRIDIDGDVIVGSLRSPGSGSGRVVIFRRQAGSWSFEQSLTVGSNGFPLAVSGNTLFVRGGVVADDVTSFAFNGAAWSFEQQVSSGPSLTDFDVFGDFAVIGEPAFERSRIFERLAGGWTEVAVLVSPDQPLSGFGTAVSLTDERCLVTAPFDDSNGVLDGGAGFVFAREAGVWAFAQRFSTVEDHPGRMIGYPGCAFDGSRAVLGSQPSGGEAAFCFEFLAPLQPYGFCGSGAPCLNTSHTAGCRNSTGLGSRIEACRSTSVLADDLVLTASRLPANKPGLFFMGGAPSSRVPLGDGLLSVASGGVGLYRFPVRQSGSNGELVEGPGLVALSHSRFGAGGHIDAGETWYFQCWFRDQFGPCGYGFNLSSALAVTFVP